MTTTITTITTQIEPPPQNDLEEQIAALQQQLREVGNFGNSRKRKHAESSPPDDELAYAIFEAEVNSQIQLLSDAKLAHSIAQAVEADAAIIAELTSDDAQFQEDRRLAFQMDGGDWPPHSGLGVGVDSFPIVEGQLDQKAASADSFDSSKRHKSLRFPLAGWNWKTSYPTESQAGPSKAYARHQETALDGFSRADLECCVCCEKFRSCDIMSLRCNHFYCRECLKELFVRSTKDHERFPPKCCGQNIPLNVIASRLDNTELENFKNTEAELSTTNRTYCCNPTCGKFIPPGPVTTNKAHCRHCGTATCFSCKKAYHAGNCPWDPSFQATIDLGKTKGWQRCFRCKEMIELSFGCNHVW